MSIENLRTLTLWPQMAMLRACCFTPLYKPHSCLVALVKRLQFWIPIAGSQVTRHSRTRSPSSRPSISSVLCQYDLMMCLHTPELRTGSQLAKVADDWMIEWRLLNIDQHQGRLLWGRFMWNSAFIEIFQVSGIFHQRHC